MPTTDKPIWNTGLINNGKLEQVYEMATVRHGHWIAHDMSIKDVPTEACSECGEWSYGYYENYCPHCGAKMDGGGKDAEHNR